MIVAKVAVKRALPDFTILLLCFILVALIIASFFNEDFGTLFNNYILLPLSGLIMLLQGLSCIVKKNRLVGFISLGVCFLTLILFGARFIRL